MNFDFFACSLSEDATSQTVTENRSTTIVLPADWQQKVVDSTLFAEVVPSTLINKNWVPTAPAEMDDLTTKMQPWWDLWVQEEDKRRQAAGVERAVVCLSS